jgi:glycosyltransferase involved in cell wall biosynthesis
MKNISPGGDVFELDKSFSTTRRVKKTKTITGNHQGGHSIKNTVLPEQLYRCGEGGLRTFGYMKSSEIDKPLISVITVIYNGRRFLERTIQSVLNQAYDNVEYIIIDGGSTDGSLDVIKKYDKVIDYWVSEPDSGVYDAMNKGVSLFHGDYVLFLGCDDRLFDIFLEVVSYFDSKTTSYYGDVILSKNNKSYDGRFYTIKLFIKNIPHQAIFYSRHVFEEYRFDSKYITVADYALNLKIFSNKRYGLKYIPCTIAYYNNESGISSTFVDHAFSKDKPGIIREYYSKPYYWIYMLLRFVFKRTMIR